MKYDVIIIGGGAAGLAAAGFAADRGMTVLIVEKMPGPEERCLLPERAGAILPITAMSTHLFPR